MDYTTPYLAKSSSVLCRIAAIPDDTAACRSQTIEQEGPFQLIQFAPLAPKKFRTPILIVYAYINRPWVLDMQSDISVVKKYLKAVFEVYMIDWGYPTLADQYLDLDDYMDFIDRSVERVKEISGTERINLHGYCLGGTLSAAYTALFNEKIKNLMLQAAPIDFNTDNSMAMWARDLDPGKIADAFHMASGPLLNTGFLLADPVNLIIGKYSGLLNMDSAQSIAGFLRMDDWIFDSPAIPGATYRQFITDWYHENRLVKGEFRALGRRVDLARIDVPVLVLAAKFDHIAPPESQKAILNLVSSRDKDVYEMAKGHIGITTSRDSHEVFWPRAIRWLEQRSEPEPD